MSRNVYYDRGDDRLEHDLYDEDCEECLREGVVGQEADAWQRSEKQPSWASHVREKGDLFYVEPYVEPPCHPYSPLEHSHLTDHSPNAKAGKPKKVVFKKLNSVKNFFSGANDEKELESCLEEHNRRNSSWGGDSQGSRMSTDKFVIKDVNLLVNPPALRAGVRHDLETVLGIIPGHEQTTPAEKSRICIKGFVPDGPALQSGELRINDRILSLNKLDINSSNVSIILAAITGPMEIVLQIQRPPPRILTPVIRSKSAPAKSESQLIRLVSGDASLSMAHNKKDVPHVALFLTLTSSEDDEADKDVLYQYPTNQAAAKLLSLRGIYLTLGDLMTTVTGSDANSSTFLLDNKIAHVGYFKLGKHLLVIGMPADQVPIGALQQIVSDVARVLMVTFGSLDRAFCEKCNKARLDHFFSLVFNIFLGCEASSRAPNVSSRFVDCLMAVKWLHLPLSAEVSVHDCLNDLESAEYGELVDEMFEDRRQYSILGSCIFYKGFLVCNHLATDVFEDVCLYCKYYCLLSMSAEQRVGQLVVWNELTLQRKRLPEKKRLAYPEPNGRNFLLIVGLKHWLLCVLLEAGVIAKRAQGSPGPDMFYVDQARNTLLQIEAQDIPSVCEDRLRGCQVPPLVPADHLLLARPTAAERKLSGNPEPETPPQRKKYLHSSLDNLRLPDDVDSSDGGSNPPLRRKGSDSSGSMNSLNKGRLRSYRSQLSLNSVGTLRKSLVDGGLDLSQVANTKLTSGLDNTLIQYLGFDSFHGVLVCPTNVDGGSAPAFGLVHKEVVQVFHKTCVHIRQLFSSHYKQDSQDNAKEKRGRKFTTAGPGGVLEHGVMFHRSPEPSEQKKGANPLKYWVTGRLLLGKYPREFYVCHHVSAAQTAVELAFKLGFGTGP